MSFWLSLSPGDKDNFHPHLCLYRLEKLGVSQCCSGRTCFLLRGVEELTQNVLILEYPPASRFFCLSAPQSNNSQNWKWLSSTNAFCENCVGSGSHLKGSSACWMRLTEIQLPMTLNFANYKQYHEFLILEVCKTR